MRTLARGSFEHSHIPKHARLPYYTHSCRRLRRRRLRRRRRRHPSRRGPHGSVMEVPPRDSHRSFMEVASRRGIERYFFAAPDVRLRSTRAQLTKTFERGWPVEHVSNTRIDCICVIRIQYLSIHAKCCRLYVQKYVCFVHAFTIGVFIIRFRVFANIPPS